MGVEVIADQRRWDDIVEGCPFGHPFQAWAWGEVKRLNGWTPHRLALLRHGAPVAAGQLLFWRIPTWGKAVAYLPRGPVGSVEDAQEFLRAAAVYARAHGALYLRIEPSWAGIAMPTGWTHVRNGILLRETYTLDLTKDETALFAAMRSKTRQYIRKAEQGGVTVVRDTTGAYLNDVWRIYRETAERAGFGLHAHAYYRGVFELYGERNALYVALVDGRADAFLWVVQVAGVAVELYGGMTAVGAARKAAYALKWRAITDMGRSGVVLYDLNGRLNAGVDQFKSGFGADERDLVGTFDLPLRPLGYWAWQTLWPAAKPIGRTLLRRGLLGMAPTPLVG